MANLYYYDVVVISHHIMIDAHEPIKATGIREHTLWTREGARGMEWNGWSSGNPHHIRYYLTRGLGGPLDYTPGYLMFYTKNAE
jgi:alpha-glucosidase